MSPCKLPKLRAVVNAPQDPEVSVVRNQSFQQQQSDAAEQVVLSTSISQFQQTNLMQGRVNKDDYFGKVIKRRETRYLVIFSW